MTAVILLAHGSPDPRSSEATHALAARLEGRTFDTVVRAAFLQHDEPTLGRVSLELAREGIASAVVVPAFLSNAFHARVDVPQAILDAQAESGLRLDVTDAIGPDGALLAALDRTLPQGPAVLATAGTSDAGAQVAFERLAAVWADRRGAPVTVAYASQAEPDIATAVARLEEETGRAAAIGSFVLFPGVLPDRIAVVAGTRAVTRPLFAELELLDVIESRVAAALRRAA
jgi:sirohydrochlorin ferrochelatase